jgi:hypothetical protein
MGLIDERRGVMSPHNWHKRQFKSDVSTSRVQQYRKRQRNVSPPGNETPPDTDTEQIQNRADTETENTYTAHGEFGQVELTKTEYEKLKAKMNGSLEDYINRLDRYSQTHSAKFHKYQSHYAVILNWYDRDVKEGRVKPLVSSRPSEEEIERERQVQFGGRKKPL